MAETTQGNACEAMVVHSANSKSIIFGVDPRIRERMFQATGKSVVVVRREIIICEIHWPAFKMKLLDMIKIVCKDNPAVIADGGKFIRELGCWITFDGYNFQLRYDEFELIYKEFVTMITR